MSQLSKRALLWIHNPFCFVCGNMIENFNESTIEHIVPRAKGGTQDPHNLAVSHAICNQLKADSLDRKEWLSKIALWNSVGLVFTLKTNITLVPVTDYGLKKILVETFVNFEFVSLNLNKIPKYILYEDSDVNVNRVKRTLKKLKKMNAEQLISASEHLEIAGTQNYWRLLFGILLIERYQEDFSQTTLLHAIWKLDTFKKKSKDSLLYWNFADNLLEICKNCDDFVFEKYIALITLKSQITLPV